MPIKTEYRKLYFLVLPCTIFYANCLSYMLLEPSLPFSFLISTCCSVVLYIPGKVAVVSDWLLQVILFSVASGI